MSGAPELGMPAPYRAVRRAIGREQTLLIVLSLPAAATLKLRQLVINGLAVAWRA